MLGHLVKRIGKNADLVTRVYAAATAKIACGDRACCQYQFIQAAR
jgi:hypothetical protein